MGGLAGALLLPLAALLLMPQGVALRAETHPVPRLRVELRLFAGLAPAWPVWDSARPRRRGPRRTSAAPAPAPAPRRRREGRGLRRNRALGAAPRLAGDLLACLRIDRLRADGRFGLEDPADTGVLWGRLVPLLAVLPPPAQVRLAPEFAGPVLAGRAEAAVSVVPLRLLPPLVRFVWAVLGPRR